MEIERSGAKSNNSRAATEMHISHVYPSTRATLRTAAAAAAAAATASAAAATTAAAAAAEEDNNCRKKIIVLKKSNHHLSTHLLAPETVLPTPGPSAATTLWPALPSARQRWRHLVRPPPVTKTVRRSPGGSKKDCSPLRHRESKVARRQAKKQKGAATYRYSTE